MVSEACTATPVAESVVEQLAVGTAPSVYVAPLVTPLRRTTGGVVSTTVMMKLPCAVLWRLLVAEQFTGVAPRAKSEPEAGTQATTTLVSRASVAVALKLTIAPAGLVASAVMSAGRCMTGGVASGSVK